MPIDNNHRKETPWIPGPVPRGFWKDESNVRRYLDWLANHLGFSKQDDWVRVSKQKFYDNYGSDLIRSRTLYGLLKNYLPEEIAMHLRDCPHRPKLSIENILIWADTFYDQHRRWPNCFDGSIEGACENWRAVDHALQKGKRGLEGKLSLHRLLVTKRGKGLLTISQILLWADTYHQQHDHWPSSFSGDIEGTSETWRNINLCLINGSRGLSGGSTLSQELVKHRNKPRHQRTQSPKPKARREPLKMFRGSDPRTPVNLRTIEKSLHGSKKKLLVLVSKQNVLIAGIQEYLQRRDLLLLVVSKLTEVEKLPHKGNLLLIDQEMLTYLKKTELIQVCLKWTTLLLVEQDDPLFYFSWVVRGMVGYINKDIPQREFANRLKYYTTDPQKSRDGIIKAHLKSTPPREKHSLTQRETEIFLYMAYGLSATEMSAALGISANTVREYMQRIRQKLNTGTRIEAGAWAAKNGWFTDPGCFMED